MAPLNSAAIAQGHLRAVGFPKKIQHLSGGIVQHIYVREGQRVEQGEQLLQLHTKESRLLLSGKLNRLLHLLLQKNYLHSIINHQSDLMFSDKVKQLSQSLGQRGKLQQRRVQFQQYQDMELEMNQIYLNQLEKIRTAIEGKDMELKSLQSQLTSLSEEHGNYEKLSAHNYLAKQILLPMERDLATLNANISQAQTNKAQYLLEKRQIKLTERNRVTQIQHYHQQQLTDTEAEIPVLVSEINQLKLRVERSTIKSPIDGYVNALNIHSIKGTIAPQAVLMEIVPSNEAFVVEAMLSPDDIDGVYVGAHTQVRLTAYNQRKVAMLPARVGLISPDRLLDDKGEPFYRVELSLEKPPANDNVSLYSGMGAEAYIETGKQTVLDYLFHSFMQQKNRAFRDQ